MRGHTLGKSGRDLRQNYIQQYLKQFLRRVHPDLFQKYPKEQLRNSTSLQDLLPLVNHEKTAQAGNSSGSSATKLLFYFRPNNPHAPQPIAADPSKDVTQNQSLFKSVEHTIPAIEPPPSIFDEAGGSAKQVALEQEVKSWQTVQSFLELCRKVGVPVKDNDQKDVDLQLDMSVQEIRSIKRSEQVQQKPLSEIFQDGLQSSFSGSHGHRRPTSTLTGVDSGNNTTGESVSQTYLGKIGGTAPALDAQVMIKSNPLLFKSPELSSSRLSKVVRTWIHWQEEDQQLMTTSSELGTPFRLSDWWRKVPVMILSSSKERGEIMKSVGGNRKGMVIVDQEMSKQGLLMFCTYCG